MVRSKPAPSPNYAVLDAAEALPLLVDEHGAKIHRLALKLCGHADDAEDLVQEIFLNAYRKWDQFHGESHPTSWLYTIAARACGRKRRRRAGEPKYLEPLSELLPSPGAHLLDPSTSPDPLDQQLRQEAKEALEAAIADLPISYRMPLVLKEIVELPVSEVAAILDLKENTVKTRLRRGRLKLREALERRLSDQLPTAGPAGPLAAGARTVCFDLLQAKMEALDRDVPFTVPPEELCQRCRAVFSTLDLARDLCLDLGHGELPPALRRELLKRMTAEAGTGTG